MCFGKIDFLFCTINNVVEKPAIVKKCTIYMRNNLAKESSFLWLLLWKKNGGYVTVVVLC